MSISGPLLLHYSNPKTKSHMENVGHWIPISRNNVLNWEMYVTIFLPLLLYSSLFPSTDLYTDPHDVFEKIQFTITF